MNPLTLLLVCFGGWMNRQQQAGIEYLRSEGTGRNDGAGESVVGLHALSRSAGVESLKLPARSPNLNAHAERFVRTIKESCLDNMILFGESALREAVFQFVEHYHQGRNHQGIENKIIRPELAEFPQTGTIRSRRRLGGLLRYYYRDAA